MKQGIQHKGVITKIENSVVFVKIEQQAACSACHAKSACLASDKKEKIIEVADNNGQFAIGEEVIISAQSSMGMQAVLIAFVIPILLVVFALAVGTKISGNESLGGLIGLAALVPYYIILYILRDKIKNKFVFALTKAADTYQPVIN